MTTANVRALRKMAANLNSIIHTANLYADTSRYIDAQVVAGVITVENLYTGERVAFDTLANCRDGWGCAITLASLL